MVRTILVAASNFMIRELIATRLRIDGFRPIPWDPTDRSSLHLEEVLFVRPDLLVIDLPIESGLSVLQGVRSHPDPVCKTMPVIFFCAEEEEWEWERALSAGASYRMRKPFSGLDLVRVVGMLIAERKPGGQQGGVNIAGLRAVTCT